MRDPTGIIEIPHSYLWGGQWPPELSYEKLQFGNPVFPTHTLRLQVQKRPLVMQILIVVQRVDFLKHKGYIFLKMPPCLVKMFLFRFVYLDRKAHLSWYLTADSAFRLTIPIPPPQIFPLINVVWSDSWSGPWGQSYGTIPIPMEEPNISKARDWF